MSYAFVLAGFVILLGGAEFLVRGAVGLAQILRVSKLVIGLTAVAFGTSAPELVVSVTAVLKGSPEIAIGNVVGSNICNVLLVLGAVAVIRPFLCTTPWLVRDGASVVFATLLMIGIGWTGSYVAGHGTLFLGLLVLFLYYCYRTERGAPASESHAAEVDEVTGIPTTVPKALLVLVVGVVGVVAGSELLVMGATDIARAWGVSEATIGLTLIAFGTSLPELATAMVAAWRRHDEIAAGNVLGSNLFNILAVLGAASLTAPIPVPDAMLVFDFWVMLGATLVLIPFMVTKKPIGRNAGIAFLAVYVGFVVAQFLGFSGMPTNG